MEDATQFAISAAGAIASLSATPANARENCTLERWTNLTPTDRPIFRCQEQVAKRKRVHATRKRREACARLGLIGDQIIGTVRQGHTISMAHGIREETLPVQLPITTCTRSACIRLRPGYFLIADATRLELRINNEPGAHEPIGVLLCLPSIAPKN